MDITEVLGKYNSKDSLIIKKKDITTLNGLISYTELKIFYCHNNSINDLTPLSNLKKLETLVLLNNRFKDISPMKELEELKYLYIGHNNIKSIDALKNLNKLKVLSIPNTFITDLSPIENKKSLSELYIVGNRLDPQYFHEFIKRNENITTVNTLPRNEFLIYQRNIIIEKYKSRI